MMGREHRNQMPEPFDVTAFFDLLREADRYYINLPDYFPSPIHFLDDWYDYKIWYEMNNENVPIAYSNRSSYEEHNTNVITPMGQTYFLPVLLSIQEKIRKEVDLRKEEEHRRIEEDVRALMAKVSGDNA